MAIADVFDACASRRVYKEAFDVDDVFEIIRKDAGSHFDPELAEIFIALKDDVKAYLKKKYDKKSNVGFEDSMDDDSLKILEEI
jgi:HD-GYP domain-containing protein (c-di-GMP phosphodiesterase class II)